MPSATSSQPSDDDFNVSLEKLRENFLFLGIQPKDDVLIKCVELCRIYRIDEEELIDQWTAFSISSLNNQPPTVDKLELLERKELSKQKAKASDVKVADAKPAVPEVTQTSSTSNNSTQQTHHPTPKTPQINRKLIPENVSQDISNSPSLQQVEAYSKRQDRGKILHTFGTNTKYTLCTTPVTVRQLSNRPLTDTACYMYNTLGQQRMNMYEIIWNIAEGIAEKHKISLNDDAEEGSHVCGRILCDADGKLNAVSVLLEVPQDHKRHAEAFPLNMKQINNYSLFPGQVVVVKGTMLKQVVNVSSLLYSRCPLEGLSQPTLAEPMQIIMAAGPFTIKNNLQYEPIQDLLRYVLEKRPHLLILTGPFLDVEHENVDDNSMEHSYEDFFNLIVASIMDPLQETETQVVIVASHRDVHHTTVYPTHPYTTKKYPNLHCVPDPCLLDVNGVVIGATSVDVLFHVGKQELCWPPGRGDRMARLSEHLLDQMHFYPLYPPDKTVFVDYDLLEKHALMEVVPHILLLPSTFKHFAKQINGCTVINPERLVKGYGGGTFARINVSSKEKLDVHCEIMRV